MFKSYLTSTVRNLRRSGLNFFFKLGGFTLALICTMVIVVYISFHTSFDSYNKDPNSIFRINFQWMENGSITKYAVVPTGIGPGLKGEFSEVTDICRVRYASQGGIKTDNKSFLIDGWTSADSTFFDIFTVYFVAGSRRKMSAGNPLILTESLAKQLYGAQDPIGKVVSFSEKRNKIFEVAGVIKDFPLNMHLSMLAILPFDALRDSAELAVDPWDINVDESTYLYAKIDSRNNTVDFISKANRYIQTRLKRQENGREKTFEIFLQPLLSIHLSAPLNMEFLRNKTDVIYLYIFGLIAALLLIIAGINYINLCIVDFQKRLKEISLRKVLGASKKEISIQIIFETVAFCFLATVLCTIFLSMFPEVFKLLDENLDLRMLFCVKVVSVLVLVLIVLIPASTVYPAYQLSRRELSGLLKKNRAVGATSVFNNSLLLAQYSISLISVCVTAVVAQQLKFVKSKDPGYDRQNIVMLVLPGGLPYQMIPVLKKELGSLDVVESVSLATFALPGEYYKDWYKVEIDGVMKQMEVGTLFFDHDYFVTMGIKLVEGRAFDVANPADANTAFIVNETAVREFGWKDPIGMKISHGLGDVAGQKAVGRVIGVVKDINLRSLYEKVEPTVMRLPESDWPGQCLYVRYHGNSVNSVKTIKLKYNELLPDSPAEYRLIENTYNAEYANENRALVILKLTSWIIVLISSIGIFSLSVYMTMKRMREFGIRKMLGATTEQIIFLQIRHFVQIAVIANVLAIPIAYWVMGKWLSGFAYKSELGLIGYFVIAFFSIILVILSVGYSALKAGQMKPLDVIKIE